MDFKDVRNEKDWNLFVKKHFKQLDDPVRFVEVLKEAWGNPDAETDSGEDEHPSLIWKHPLRGLFPNYQPPPWTEIKLIDYPAESTEHPFDPKAIGSYFIHLSNRDRTISYLGNSLNDFSHFKLIEFIPMGRASLSVMQRVFLIQKNKEEYRWAPETIIRDTRWDQYDNRIYSLFDPGEELNYGYTKDWHDKDTRIRFESLDETIDYARKAINESDYPILCGLRLRYYQWH